MNDSFKNPEKIAILLSTFNGERYLAEQLDSLFCQTCKSYHLYIRDDCSSDTTPDIILQYKKKHPDKITILDNLQIRKRAFQAFMEMLSEIESSYYMFCDQDDVWFPDKIEKTLQTILQKEKEFSSQKPILVFSDVTLVNKNLEVLQPSFFQELRYQTYKKNPHFLYIHNVVTGLTMMINHSAKRILFPVSPYASMHDEWIALCLFCRKGILQAIEDPTAYYRQHQTNVVGAAQDHSPRRFFRKKRLLEILSKAKLIHKEFGVSYTRFLFYKFIYNFKR